MYWCRIIDLFVVRTTILWRSAKEKDKQNVDIYDIYFISDVEITAKSLYQQQKLALLSECKSCLFAI